MTRKHLLCLAAVCGFLVAPAMADQLQLTGVVRDFKRGDQTGGHLDFETAHMSGRGGYGRVSGLVTMGLSEDGKPVYNPTRPSQDTIKSADTFAMWYQDVVDVNVSKTLALTLDNGQETSGGVYTYLNNNFFPVDGDLLGNQGLNHNFHFTFELHTTFTYAPGQKFTFIGDDDVWVYINGKKVIDLGGVHSVVTGSVVLFDGKVFVEKTHFATTDQVQEITTAMAADLASKWSAAGLGTLPDHLKAGGKYVNLQLAAEQDCTLDFFFAERHTTQSNFRIDTSIQLVEVPPTTVSPLYD
ncbi:MAG: fibro-slime domain-containing protein [Phycisphaeraceae bacterium]|nr:fibro-slime domain-containing protein [Phycisphaeraceae bacterium]